ncbi:hypothetical protein OOK60_14100 [Trichothermofontia sichuanensis B231]|uniref:hypothetical protein n=1 Tax=Trichothermofontia sichuanensis TaxID=3045816 RepID=UPI002245F38C|nr:hypothetical protein [Trichothermofontia sichuanensis]UZQ53620.1 hypothetical protein OOK60_14100 [Trichothermofontia sichuanensis B231]
MSIPLPPMKTALIDPPLDWQPLDWADAARIIQRWAEPPLLLAGGATPTGNQSGLSTFPGETLGERLCQLAQHCLASSRGWQQACQIGWEGAIQDVARYAPPVAALSLASLSGGYLLQAPLAAPLDLRAPSFAVIENSTFTPRFTIPSPPIAAFVAIAYPERLSPEMRIDAN